MPYTVVNNTSGNITTYSVDKLGDNIDVLNEMENITGYSVDNLDELNKLGNSTGYSMYNLEDLNAREKRLLTPLMVYLFFISIAGTIGNGVSLYIYSFNFTPSNSRCFLIFVSFLELISCLVIIPCEISLIFRQLTFSSDLQCKLFIFINISQVSAGSVILVVIAVDRWRKICYPFKWQMSLKQSKLLCAFTIVFGVAAALPSTSVYGVRYFTPHGANITASECSINNDMEITFYPLAYNGLFWVLVLIGISCLSVLYYRIVQVVKRREEMHAMKFGARPKAQRSVLLHRLQRQFTESIDAEDKGEKVFVDNQAPNTSPVDCKQTNTICTRGRNKPYLAVSMDSLDNLCDGNSDATVDSLMDEPKLPKEEKEQTSGPSCTPITYATDNVKVNRKSADRREVTTREKHKTKKSNRSRNVTLIMFVITISSLVCFIPYLCLGLQRAIYEHFTDTLSDQSRVAYKCLIRSYFLKGVLTPLIYGLCDQRFRQVVRNIFNHFITR